MPPVLEGVTPWRCSLGVGGEGAGPVSFLALLPGWGEGVGPVVGGEGGWGFPAPRSPAPG